MSEGDLAVSTEAKKDDRGTVGGVDVADAAHASAPATQFSSSGAIPAVGGVFADAKPSASDLAFGTQTGTSAPKTGKDTATTSDPPAAAPKPDDTTKAAALAPNELVLTRDPAFATGDHLAWFRTQVKAKLASWGVAFDETRIRMATDGAASVVALQWDAAWGNKPITREVPFSMAPIDASVAVAAVQKLKGWSKVDGADQTMLTHLLGGETNNVSDAARNHLRGVFAGLDAKSDVDQAKALKGVIGAKDAAPAVVDEQVASANVPFKLEGPTVVKDYAFRGKTADAETWNAKFDDGVTVPIVAPKAPDASLHYHSVNQAADAASYLPKAARSLITTILLNVQENPDDAYWATQYSQPNFHSYMTAGASGVVTIYPDKGALPNANYMRGTIQHETGHTWSKTKWGEDTTKGKWVDWQAAMDKDKVSVSGYASASIDEDVAETIQTYVSTKNTPKFDEYKSIVPGRYAILEKEYK
jgi:hypothetical protein